MKIIMLIFISLTIINARTFKGYVFEDSNQNGIKDKSENGVDKVMVSNQRDVVLTDEKGYFDLPYREKCVVFITKPAAYDLPLNERNLPQFYYIHQPKGSPAGLKYKGIDPTGPAPDTLFFALHKGKYQKDFSAIITGDPQPRDVTEVGYFRDDIVPEIAGFSAEFYMALGDVAYDNLDVYDPLNRATAQLGMPVYNVHGNHDMNFRVEDDEFAAETFKRIHGPEYYSFDYGMVHFVVFDDVDYFGWKSAENKKGGYRGYLHEDQITWLKNDLKYTDPEKLIVFCKHIPIFSNVFDGDGVSIVNRDELFEIIKDRKHLLALSGHLHVTELFSFDEEQGWDGDNNFFSINVGAGCGAWWSGPKDSRGIPESICSDGSPNGFFEFGFSGNQFKYNFYPANQPVDYQMRISQPMGVLKPTELNNQKIIANIFIASPEARVVCEIDGKTSVKMEPEKMIDPFIESYFELYKEFLPTWLKPRPSNHIWTADLPEGLEKGTHRISIYAIDYNGKLFTGTRIFEVE